MFSPLFYQRDKIKSRDRAVQNYTISIGPRIRIQAFLGLVQRLTNLSSQVQSAIQAVKYEIAFNLAFDFLL